MSSAWRSQSPVLVSDAQALGSLAVIRSLGRAGYPVHACSQRPDALGFFSTYCGTRATCPSYSDAGFLNWLRRYIKENQIRAIIASEGFLLSIRGALQEFSPLLPFSASEAVIYAAMSKADQFAAMNQDPTSAARSHLPPFLLLQEGEEIPAADAFEALGRPLFLKVDGCYSRGDEGGRVYKAATGAEARELAQKLLQTFSKVLVQGHVPGRGAGVFFLIWDGQPLAEFMHLRLHEVPHTGGVSSYRKSWWHQAMRDDALAKMKAMNWQGVGMMEYRWDPATDQFHFLEMNGRFWGSLHLMLFAGVDFPTLLLDTFLGHPPSRLVGPGKNISCRYTFPREVMYVWSRWKDTQLSWTSKLGFAIEFLLLSLDPRVCSDLWFPGDRLLYWRQAVRAIRELVGA
jgi:predicted ATP-grasp superfamily ATP-dependent carboligase